MKKIVTIVFGVLILTVIVAALAGIYKFNYLANQPGYDVDGNKVKAEAEVLTGDYVGMSVNQAQARAKADGVPFRIVMADGEAFAVTMDFRPGRINATVENGVIVSYDVEGGGAENADSVSYNQNSWKDLIPASCQSFFDGCNNCQRVGGSGEAACTRKGCAEYQKPECLDKEA